MAESLLLPVVRGVVGKAGDELVQTVTRMWGVEDDRDKLKRQLLAVQDILADAELKSKDRPAIKEWMKAFRSVAYEADDVLEDFQYEALRRKAQIRESMKRKVLSYLTHDNPLLFRLNVSRKLKDVLEKIDELVTETNKFGLVARAEAASIVHPQTHSGLDDLMEIVGRDDDKEVIVKLLLEQHDNKKVEVLPIIGMGGLGKTTLAKMVYNDRRIQQHFELPMWLFVSDEFNVSALLRSIIELAKKEECHLPNSIELLRGRLQEVLGRKRYLLVLDDVWNEEEQKWVEELRPLLCSAGGSGSVIVVTSRSQRVASIMGTLPSHNVAYLTENDSWELFWKKAFGKGVEEKPELVTIGKCIVGKCKGLPLALKTMGGLMSSKCQVQEWEAIVVSKTLDNVEAADGILPILKLSYRHLSPEMKQCFAFCAVFPKDYKMEKDILIQLWMSNGFLQEEGAMDFEQKGQLIFNELVWRSFFQDVKVNKYYWYNGYNQQREFTECKMHDLMHDLVKSITDECVCAQELSQQKASVKDVRHVMSSFAGEENSKLFEDVAPLRTSLTSFRPFKSLSFVRLRALQCNGQFITERQSINVRHLRYLDLSRSSIESLPDSICMLYNLQSLRLNYCFSLQHLPEGMRYMSKLRHLYLFGCNHLERMPPSIGKLNNLRTLTTFVVGNKDGCGIEELKDMQHLSGLLELRNLRKIKNGSNAKEAKLHLKQNIDQLVLSWGHYEDPVEAGNEEVLDEVGNEEEVLESLVPPLGRLKLLVVHSYGGTKISSWMNDHENFQLLKVLEMYKCRRCKNLPIIWLSPFLEVLKLAEMDSLTTICDGVDAEVEGCNNFVQIFPKLKMMGLNDLKDLERWVASKAGKPITSVTFPELERLNIRNCPKLASIPEAPVLTELQITGDCKIAISSCTHLTTLSNFWYRGGLSNSTSMQVVPFSSWPSLVQLRLDNLVNIMMPPEEQQCRSPLESLRSLEINKCNCFFAYNLSKQAFGFWEYFVFVEELVIKNCDDLVRWPEEELQSLIRLRSLEISFCENLRSSLCELLPQLEKLKIIGCDGLLEIPKLPASLEDLEITFCRSLVLLSSNIRTLAKLRVLRVHLVWACNGLRRLLDGMGGLSALQELYIEMCPGIETLPNGLLQRLPMLKVLRIVDCPNLARRCRRGEEYWEFVSPIPCLCIWNRNSAQQGSSTVKGYIKRLLPTCSQF